MTFNEIPDNRLVPFVYVEFDSSRAVSGAGVMPYKGLLIGNKLSTGSVAQKIPKKVTNINQVNDYFGEGSIISNMAKKWFENNETTELTCLGLDDAGGSTAASGSFAFSGTATEPGTVFAYIGGERVKIGVSTGDTAATIATAFATELAKNEWQFLPVSNHVVSGTLHVHMKNKGAFGNDLDLRLNYNDGEALPSGITCTVNAMASGATNPTLTDAITGIGSEQYHLISHPYTEDTNMDIMEAELDDRWGPLVQNDGAAIVFKSGSYATLSTYAASRNSQFSTVMGGYKVPTSPWQMGAAICAVVAYYAQIDRGRPFQTLQLKGCLPPAVADRFTAAERNLLLIDGIATFFVGAGDTMQIERLVTTYTTNSQGANDPAYRDLNTVLILSYLRWDFRNYILRKFPRSKLGSDGTRYAQGQTIVTPKIFKAEAIAKFTEWMDIGLVEDLESFKQYLVVERNGSDVNRLDCLLPIDVINQLIVTASQIQFRL